MVGAWNFLVELARYLCMSGELSPDACEPTVRPWSLRIWDDGKRMAYPWSLCTTENMKWWNRTNGPRAVVSVSNKGIPMTPRMVRGKIFGIKPFWTQNWGACVDTRIWFIAWDPIIHDVPKRAMMNSESAGQSAVQSWLDFDNIVISKRLRRREWHWSGARKHGGLHRRGNLESKLS